MKNRHFLAYCKAHQERSITKVKRRRLLDVKVLIINEGFMDHSVLYDKLDAVERMLRGVDLPFG